MTLKEKIQTIIIDDYGNLQKILLLEQIADKYAIEFAKWILKQSISPSLDDLYVDEKGDLISVKQLLKIFKK